jgi:hypothetical protein
VVYEVFPLLPNFRPLITPTFRPTKDFIPSLDVLCSLDFKKRSVYVDVVSPTGKQNVGLEDTWALPSQNQDYLLDAIALS